MAVSRVPVLKMRNLLFGLILGLLAVVHSTPVDTLTQIPKAKAEDDVLREVLTDGFLIDSPFPSVLTTESPRHNTTVQASEQPSSDSNESDEEEGSGESSESVTFLSFEHGDNHHATTTQSVSHTSTVLPSNTEVPSSDTPSTTIPCNSSPAQPDKALASTTPDQTTVPQTTTASGFDSQSSDYGSGDGEMFGQDPTTTSSNTTSSPEAETSTDSSTSTSDFITRNETQMFAGIEEFDSGSGSGMGQWTSGPTKDGESPPTSSSTIAGSNEEATTAPSNSSDAKRRPQGRGHFGILTELAQNNEGNSEKPDKISSQTALPVHKGHSTPGWMIIVGFIVGLAALVMLFVAIATRDKWNGPSQASKGTDKTNSSNQQREVEMETFLSTDGPRENGKAAEYTVIPLDELPENYSSH